MNPTTLQATIAASPAAGAWMPSWTADASADDGVSCWAPEQSFSTQFCFAFERPQDAPAEGSAADLRSATRIDGTYTVGYNAASGLLSLSGTLHVDGATYFVDDQLTIDQAASYDAYLSAGATDRRTAPADGRRLTAWSISGMPERGGSLKLLAGLAVMAHLGLRRHD
ncbi:hypothetical protein [Aquabacterium humicola]|uniref:hypothetical protein n=1 Tax=Aquabacterium humicola TaxID=3237377 RepID=UPI002542969D|nr:hypothetical protein [Rubrivivax pictus]